MAKCICTTLATVLDNLGEASDIMLELRNYEALMMINRIQKELLEIQREVK